MELSAHFQMKINIYTYFLTKWRPLQRTQSYLLILTIINGGRSADNAEQQLQSQPIAV